MSIGVLYADTLEPSLTLTTARIDTRWRIRMPGLKRGTPRHCER
jgi:hypothetical protein